ncbi:hypothetical protein E2C01_026139 [Portunus trituberculatus]|uniref:Uncharacterized protein n=1 Tax=Portunus trituberculatus TaxID=210409 RepID=A0A5B7EEP4_PORTR|nr:hypothetical protein [Portunus trituberculatus]
MYKIVNGIEKLDKEDLVIVTEDRRTRGYVKIRMRQCVKDIDSKALTLGTGPHHLTLTTPYTSLVSQ